jgi:ubiquinone/menaquinone biosynthesis C-methylase UbiE
VNRADFDRFADEYRALHQRSISASGESPEYFAEYKIVDLKRIVGAGDIDTGRFLDVGAGIGASVPYFRTHFPRAHLICIDVSMRSLRIGIERCAGNGSFVAFDGRRLPFDDAAFDCVFANCVFHHIAPADQRALLQDLRRVLKRDGHVVIYEHNPLNPLTLRAVNACEFDRNARLIRAGSLKATLAAAGFRQLETEYRVFFPRMLRGLRRFERSLAWLPLGAQYFVCGRK